MIEVLCREAAHAARRGAVTTASILLSEARKRATGAADQAQINDAATVVAAAQAKLIARATYGV
jgi:hypothetical protein